MFRDGLATEKATFLLELVIGESRAGRDNVDNPPPRNTMLIKGQNRGIQTASELTYPMEFHAARGLRE
jgi:hypothetical protein